MEGHLSRSLRHVAKSRNRLGSIANYELNEFIRLTAYYTSVKQEHRGTITACTYRCPE